MKELGPNGVTMISIMSCLVEPHTTKDRGVIPSGVVVKDWNDHTYDIKFAGGVIIRMHRDEFGVST